MDNQRESANIKNYQESNYGKRPRLIQTPFSKVIILTSLLLMLLPFVTTLNSFLTNLFLKWELYRVLQDMVVPYEGKVLAGLFNLLGFSANAVARGVWVNGAFLEIQWNCLGWQSAVLLLASFLGGFQHEFSWSSRIEVVLIGFLGTYLVNFFRLSTVGILAVKVNISWAIFFHDYLALVLVIAWFGVFWWFSYSYVLEGQIEHSIDL